MKTGFILDPQPSDRQIFDFQTILFLTPGERRSGETITCDLAFRVFEVINRSLRNPSLGLTGDSGKSCLILSEATLQIVQLSRNLYEPECKTTPFRGIQESHKRPAISPCFESVPHHIVVPFLVHSFSIRWRCV